MTSPALPAVAPDGTWAMPAGAGPCRTWPLQPGCGCLPVNPTEWDATQRGAVEAATEILWRLTAGQYGLCRETVRPCTPTRRGLDTTCRCGRGLCGCGPTELALPGPVHWTTSDHPGITYPLEVWIDGQPLDPDAYQLYDAHRLVRIDGGTWPHRQRLDRPYQPASGDLAAVEGTFAVTYWRGTPAPAAARRSVALFACELWKACTGSRDCRIPTRVQTIDREGISYTVVDPQEFIAAGRTGLTEVDLWLSAANPHRLRSPSAVITPDLTSFYSEHTTGDLGGDVA